MTTDVASGKFLIQNFKFIDFQSNNDIYLGYAYQWGAFVRELSSGKFNIISQTSNFINIGTTYGYIYS